MKQKTLKKEIVFQGAGVHLGQACSVVLKPAASDFGIVFVNSNNSDEKIKIGDVIPKAAMHASVVQMNNFTISTLEHLMAAISALGIDNLLIEINGVEVPILDGSALSFVHGIIDVGLVDQDAEKRILTPKEEIIFEEKGGRFIKILPAKICRFSKAYDKQLYFDYVADFEHPLLGQSRLNGVFSERFFVESIAPARTFGFLEQLPFLRRHGLALGTTLGNTVVIGEEEFLNERRFEDEFVRHKFLDLLGDLALLGKSLAGTLVAQKTGHNFNRFIVQHYIENPDKWNLI